MAVIAAFQPVIDSLSAAATSLNTDAENIKTALANAPLPAGAASAQDVSDTLSALETAQQGVTSGQAAVAGAVPSAA